uniref:GATA-type domain-containing protein n=1 Tax=Meloidogyne enterolobii TaxID=390850 RepID=A0A6V7WIV4_MELEN|nr:unnamed protein product [Meloidogyne enterolobii]
MIKLIISSLYLLILLNIKCDGRKVIIVVKIKDDWEEKREFIYLKNVELEERFVLNKIIKNNNKYDISYNYNIEGFLRRIDVNNQGNYYNVEIVYGSEYAVELKRRILINIAKNKSFQSILIGFEKQLLRRNQFHKTKNNYYETSILDETLDHIKVNKKELLKENIENYKNKLLSSYWKEINLIGYKIELLEKQKVDYPKELRNRMLFIENKISENNEQNKRNCFNCRNVQSKIWHNCIKEYYLCQACGVYKRQNNGKFRPKGIWFKAHQRITKDRKCSICEATKTSNWHRHSIPEQYVCNACYQKQLKIKNKTNKNQTEYETNK